MKKLLALIAGLALCLPLMGAVYPARTNANNVFYGTNTFQKPVFLEDGISGSGAGLTNVTALATAAPIWDGVTTNFTMITNVRTYIVYGTNQLITFPDATTCTPGVQYRVSSTNGWGNFTLTNFTGAQTIRDGVSLAQKYIGVGSVAYMHNGNGQWVVASKTRVVLPNAQFSCTTNIPMTAANTAYPVTFNSTDFNNSQGIALALGTNGTHFSKMWITNSGEYMFLPSIVEQFTGNHTIRYWFRSNDTNIPNSCTPAQGAAGGNTIRVITVPFVVNVTRPTSYEIWVQSDNTGDSLPAQAASGNYPLAPSVICPVTRISDPWP